MDVLDDIHEKLSQVPDPLALLEALFARSPNALQIYRADGHCVLVNRAFVELFGSAPPPEYNVLRDEIAERTGVLGLVRRAFAGETISTPVIWYDPRELTQVKVTEGRRIAFSSTFVPLLDRQGRVTWVAIAFKDATAEVLSRERAERERDELRREGDRRRRLEEEREALLDRARNAGAEAEAERARLHALFMQAPVAISIQRGDELAYELANPTYRQFLANQELVGRRLRDVLPDDATLARILREVYATGVAFSRQEHLLRVVRPGSERLEDAWFNFVCQPTRGPGGAIDGVLTCAIEVTEQVLARRRIEALAGDLREHVQRLERVEAELEDAVRVRDTFLSIASHELKTPLTALRLQEDALLRGLQRHPETLPVERVVQRLESMRQHGDRLARLIDELLDVTHMRDARLELRLERLDLAAVVGEVVARYGDELSRARCAIEWQASAPVEGRWDRVRLEQVVANLLSNAIRYGAGQPIAIAVDGDERVARLRVRDRGIGIAPADQARIFERFERATSERHYGGLGLGLWLVRRIVDALGGRITVESEPGRGATFTVELPREPPPAP